MIKVCREVAHYTISMQLCFALTLFNEKHSKFTYFGNKSSRIRTMYFLLLFPQIKQSHDFIRQIVGIRTYFHDKFWFVMILFCLVRNWEYYWIFATVYHLSYLESFLENFADQVKKISRWKMNDLSLSILFAH